MAYKNLCVPFNAPLNKEDTEEQTKGCRANNPDICANCYMPGVCAFASKDGICRKPCLPLQSYPENIRKLFATSGSPAEYTQTSPLTQIILFRHTRL